MGKRGRTKGIFFDKEFKDIRLSQFYNDDTLNIFSDASFIGGFYDNRQTGKGKGCYCCIAVCKDQIIDQQIAISSHSTVPESELKGIRRALSFANQYKSQYKFINIFSDSLYSVNAINHYHLLFNNILNEYFIIRPYFKFFILIILIIIQIYEVNC